MAAIKTKQHEGSVTDFIERFADTEKKKHDSYFLVNFFEQITGHPPKMWGPSIIGFGVYHYKSERSKQEGDWPIVGFSPRKAAISLYVFSGQKEDGLILKKLGKFKMGKACIYIKKIEDIQLDALKELIESSIRFVQKKYPVK